MSLVPLKRLLTGIAILASAFFLSAESMAKACQGPTGGKEGNCAPDFSLPDTNGKQVKLSSFRGKVVFLNFWATWCEPCRVEIPAMEKAYEKLKGKEFEMLAVSIDSEGMKEIKTFFGENWPPFPILMDADHKVSHSYETFKVPETYIIDKTGKIRDKVQGIKAWDDSLIIHYLELLSEV